MRHPYFDNTGFFSLFADGADSMQANIALNHDAFQSSTKSSTWANRTVDGNSSTFSHTTNDVMSPWWAVDLGRQEFIHSLVLINRQDCCREHSF